MAPNQQLYFIINTGIAPSEAYALIQYEISVTDLSDRRVFNKILELRFDVVPFVVFPWSNNKIAWIS